MRIGSLFSGYGGLDMGVQQAIGGTVAWHCEFDAAPSKILAHHWPEVPNLGDITTADWSQVEPVDVITGGFPCQDVSHAGRRQGLIRDGEGRTRSGLWGHMLRAIDTLRPAMVVAENVRGLLSARADSDVEPCPWCLGDGQDQPAMRALGAVLADLADIGYDAAWCGLRAADVGAPHGRFRVFITAWPADSEGDSRWLGNGDAIRARRETDGRAQNAGHRDTRTLLRTPTAQLAVNGGSQHPDKRREGGHGPTLADEIEHLLPTPEAADGSGGRRSAELGGTRPSGAKRAITLATALEHLLPTPTAADAKASGGDPGTSNVTLTDATVRGRRLTPPSAATQLLPTPMVGSTSPSAHGQISGQYRDAMAEALTRWGDYAATIDRWERVLGRPAPAPTEATGRNGAHRLSPAFVEWLMGLPAGHVTDVPDITRNAQLKALGNGVVPQQAATAVRHLLAITRTEVAA